MAVGRFGQKRRSLGETLRPLAGHAQFGVSLELGDRRVVQSPIRAGKLGIAVGRQPHGHARQRRVLRIAGGQLPHHAEHRPLDARMEHVVVGRQSPPRRPRGAPAGPVGADPLDPVGLRPAGPPHRLQLRQGRGELDHGNQLQLFPVEQPQEHLQHVFADRVLAGSEEHARIVARRRLAPARSGRSCCRRPAPPASDRCSRHG